MAKIASNIYLPDPNITVFYCVNICGSCFFFALLKKWGKSGERGKVTKSESKRQENYIRFWNIFFTWSLPILASALTMKFLLSYTPNFCCFPDLENAGFGKCANFFGKIFNFFFVRIYKYKTIILIVNNKQNGS